MPVLPKCCSALVVAAALCFLQEMHSARPRRPPTNETLTQAPPKLPRAQARGIDRDTRYCPGYYDLLGQWENAFVCNSSQYMYCCGTCSQRYCCQNRKQLLRQNACSNHHSQNGTIKLAVPKKESPGEEYDPASDKTHVIVYVVCGLIAFLLLLGVLAKMGLDKAARVARDIHMPKTLSEILHYQTHGSEDEELKSHSLHSLPLSREESMSRSYKKHVDKGRFNNIHVTSALMTPLGPSQSHPHLAYLPAICKPEYNHFASLKRLADKEMSEYYSKRHLAELAASSTLPLNVPTALPHSPEHHYYGPYGSAAMLVELRGPPTAMALASATASSCCPCEAPVGDGQSSELDSYLAEKHRCELYGHEDARAAYHTWRGSSDRNVHYPGEIFNSTPTLSRNERRCASQRQAPTEDSYGILQKGLTSFHPATTSSTTIKAGATATKQVKPRCTAKQLHEW
uniref:Shisa N-terminal domain-containing protein n=1 Tax=Eptatretus burgeri TaxID=7764 RepID=A0A8C4QXV8_EPTBU